MKNQIIENDKVEKSPQDQCLHTVLPNFNVSMARAQFGTSLFGVPKNPKLHHYGAGLAMPAPHCRGFVLPNFSPHPLI